MENVTQNELNDRLDTLMEMRHNGPISIDQITDRLFDQGARIDDS